MSKKQSILLTGSHGFIGSHLMPALQERGHFVQPSSLELANFDSIRSDVQRQNWDTIIHLAGMSHVPTCEKDPAQAFQINLNGTALLLEAIRQSSHKPHLVFPSTAHVYAPASGKNTVVIDESHPIQPQNVYAQTKWQAEVLLKDSAAKTGTRTTVLRLFNHTHRTQPATFFLPHLYSTMTQAASSNQEELVIPVGNLDIERDIGCLDDLINAFVTTVERPASPQIYDVFNICSGHVKNLKTLAQGLAKLLQRDVRFEVEAARVRPDEVRSLCGSSRKLTEATGWVPSCKTENDLLTAFLK